MGLSVIPAASLFFFNDDQALGAESEAHERDGGSKAAGEVLGSVTYMCNITYCLPQHDALHKVQELISGLTWPVDQFSHTASIGHQLTVDLLLKGFVAGAKDEEAVPLAALQKRRLFGLRQTAIPYILATADCITGLASGMTIKCGPIS